MGRLALVGGDVWRETSALTKRAAGAARGLTSFPVPGWETSVSNAISTLVCRPEPNVGGGHVDATTIDGASALLNDPDYWTQCWMMTAA
jgi:hypothetical protein